MVADVQSAGVTVNYDIWNEPDNGSFWEPGYAGTQYFQMWDSAVNEIRRLVPLATIVGPSVSNFNNTYITEFLSHVKSAGTVPNYLNWHFSGTPVADAATVNGDLSADGISGVKLAMNEYLGTSQENAGDEAWYLAQLATSGISYADHAIWNYCCNVPNLDQTLVQNSSGAYVPTGQWWVYKDYADVTGRLAAVSDGSSTDAVAAEDSSRQIATVLLGDDAGNTGTVTLNLNGLSSIPWAFSSTGANVVVHRIPDQDPLAQPAVVSSQVLAPGTASLSLPVNWAAANDAYFVTVTPAVTDEVVVDGAASAPGPNYLQYGSGWGETTGVPDMYDGTANWSFTPGTTAVLRFTGNQVALHAVKDVDQGEMDISVDGSAPVTIDDYAPTRNASGIVWTSPVLDPGPHVVTITVDSARNPASTGNNIAIDRAAFNELLEGQHQVILSCDRYPKEVEGLEERLKSRFGWGLTVAIEPPELETCVAILMTKAQHASVLLPEEVAFFIAKRIRSNVRELEGALRRVIADSPLHRPPDHAGLYPRSAQGSAFPAGEAGHHFWAESDKYLDQRL